MVDPVVLDQVGQWAQHFANTTGLSRGMALRNTSPGTGQEAVAVSPAAPVTEMWLGETGSAFGGGAENVSPGALVRQVCRRDILAILPAIPQGIERRIFAHGWLSYSFS